MKTVLPKIINNSQTGFLKDRYIGENIRILFEILEHVEEHELPGILFFSDFEKAFDSIDHDFLIQCLKHFNFNDDFTKWIRLFYTNAKSYVINNGFQSDFSYETRCSPGMSFIPISIHYMYEAVD